MRRWHAMDWAWLFVFVTMCGTCALHEYGDYKLKTEHCREHAK